MTSGTIEVPGHPTWFKYDFPLKPVSHPSRADYSKDNVAPLIEGFGGILGDAPNSLELLYENRTQTSGTIISGSISGYTVVTYPTSGGPFGVDPCKLPKSPALLRYETAARKSSLLKLFQDNSPANIKYFQPLCSGIGSGLVSG